MLDAVEAAHARCAQKNLQINSAKEAQRKLCHTRSETLSHLQWSLSRRTTAILARLVALQRCSTALGRIVKLVLGEMKSLRTGRRRSAVARCCYLRIVAVTNFILPWHDYAEQLNLKKSTCVSKKPGDQSG